MRVMDVYQMPMHAPPVKREPFVSNARSLTMDLDRRVAQYMRERGVGLEAARRLVEAELEQERGG